MIKMIKKTDQSILEKHDEFITKSFLYGDGKSDLSCYKSIISSAIEFSSFLTLARHRCAEADLGLLQHPRWSSL